MANVRWDSPPDYDEWGYDSWWDCQDWIMYHKKLVEHFGKKNANSIWNYAFAKSGNLSGNLDCRTFNSGFRDYVRENNLSPYENAGIIAPVLQGVGVVQDVASGTVDTVGDVASGLLDTVGSLFGGSNLRKTLTVVVIIGAIVGGAYVYKSFKSGANG
jgi:hypothetical protein